MAPWLMGAYEHGATARVGKSGAAPGDLVLLSGVVAVGAVGYSRISVISCLGPWIP